MRALISGAGGFIGSALSARIQKDSGQVLALTRKPCAPEETSCIHWDIKNEQVENKKLQDIDVVFHLAGENIAGYWSAEKKRRIIESRIGSSQLLISALKRMEKKPEVLISASAVGIYGSTGEQDCDEKTPPGSGFLAETAAQWEKQMAEAEELGIRTVFARFGVVLHPCGGALKKMLLPFKLGLGGRLGDGQQWLSWIWLDDAIDALMFCVENPSISGPVNICSDNPLRNVAFSKELATALHRPNLGWLPKPVLRLALGELADEILLSSCKARPAVLKQHGFDFKHTSPGSALKQWKAAA